ncbi:zinc finger BED domain-containing protein 1-like [Aphis craccivora]|uniref:Zinc finger BED domain-containing protein 1-like n=1 Tax=Aphis craccivora TaxID=307492 RepID=A0A6G0WQP0_APHCR|nr:zinc finger BED domain-containing protein 1-like [Aphis craccivora]
MKKRFCILATSVPCERIFSKAGQTITEKRSRLHSKNFEKMIFLNFFNTTQYYYLSKNFTFLYFFRISNSTKLVQITIFIIIRLVFACVMCEMKS